MRETTAHMQRLAVLFGLAWLLTLSAAQNDIFVRDQLMVYRIGDITNNASLTGTTTVPIYIDYYSRTTGEKFGSYFAGSGCTHSQSAAYSGHLSLAAEKSLVSFGCFRTSVGTTSPENDDSTVTSRVVAYLESYGQMETSTTAGGELGVGKGYITSTLNPFVGEYAKVNTLVSFSGNSENFYAVRLMERYSGVPNWRQQSEYTGDNGRALAFADPDSPSSTTVAYTTPGAAWLFYQRNLRQGALLIIFPAVTSLVNDPNGLASINYNGINFFYLTDASVPHRIYKAYQKGQDSFVSFYLNDNRGEYFGITARLISNTVYIYVTYRPDGAVYSEVWEFTDAAGEGNFVPLSMKKLFRSDDDQFFKGIAFSPVAAFCRNGVADGGNSYDTGVDCGGRCADKCPGGSSCKVSSDCESNNCQSKVCANPTCYDGVKNQGESDVDCGGPCGKCTAGKRCTNGTDCESLKCSTGVCTLANCFDGVKNQNEIGVDCGGYCVSFGQDKCSNGNTCNVGSDCKSGFCTAAGICDNAACTDGVKNGGESDVDCGNPNTGCALCAVGKSCDTSNDCTSSNCKNGTCQPPSCFDGIPNGWPETPTGDCGQYCHEQEGGRLCNIGETCWSSLDCKNVSCKLGDYWRGGRQFGFCQQPACGDGFQNSGETDIDCGGLEYFCATRCPLGKGCLQNSDCFDGYCKNGKCATPRCDDGVKNGLETDVDCGGDFCAFTYNITCDVGQVCKLLGDCTYFYGDIFCVQTSDPDIKKCGPLPGPQAPQAPPPEFPPFSEPPSSDVCRSCAEPTPWCDYFIQTCVGGRIIPIIQCVEKQDQGYFVLFSYENTLDTNVKLTAVTNFVNLDIIGNMPMTFKPGKQGVFPYASFIGFSTGAAFAEWYVDGYAAGAHLEVEYLRCPDTFEFDLLSASDTTTLSDALSNITTALASTLQVSEDQLNITVGAQQKRSGGSVITIGVSSASAVQISSFVSRNLASINEVVPEANVIGAVSRSLPTEQAGSNAPSVNPPTTSPTGSAPSGGSTPTSGSSPSDGSGTTPSGSNPIPSGTTPSGSVATPSDSGNQPVTKQISAAQQVASSLVFVISAFVCLL